MNNKKTFDKKKSSSIERAVIVLVLIVVINIGIMYMLLNQSKTITLLQEQQQQLTQDQRILSSSEEIYAQYEGQIEKILRVFPDEETVLDFLQTLETLSKTHSTEYTVKFASRSPLPESDKLFLLFTITLKTDKTQLDAFLDALENLPYMTRVLTMNAAFPDPASQAVDAALTLKLYVKNPFEL